MSFDPYEFDRSYGRNVPETLGQYTAKTFLWMMVGLLVSFGVGIVGWSTDLTWVVYRDIPGFHLILLVGTLVISFTMVWSWISPSRQKVHLPQLCLRSVSRTASAS